MLDEISTTNFLLLIVSTVVLLYWLRGTFYYCASEFYSIVVVPIAIVGFVLNKNRLVERMVKLFKYYHPVGKMWIGPGLYVTVSDPGTIETVLKQHISKGAFYDHMKRFLGNGLLTASEDIWRIHRKVINQSFSQNMLNSYLDSFVKHSRKVVENLRIYQNTHIDIFHELSKCTFKNLCYTAMGVDASDVDPHDECMDLIDRALKLIGKRLYNPLFQFEQFWKLFGQAKEEQYVLEMSRDYVNRIIKSSTRKETSSTNQFNELIKSWPDEEIPKEVLTMIVTGSDTTAVETSFCMLMVAIHQDVQEKVYQELFEIFGNDDRDVTSEDLRIMTYLDRVIKETMRIFPVGPVVSRKAQENFKLGDCTVSKGTNLVFPIIFVHRNPIYWPDPLKFDPDRFLPEEIAKRPRYAFMPFSVPPRNCIGMKYAEMSMKVLLSTILRHYKVFTKQYDSVESIHLNTDVLLTAANGYGVTLVPRLQ